MADLPWGIKDEGLLDVEAFFEYAGYKARDMREPLGEIQLHIMLDIVQAFETEGWRTGGWDPPSDSYLMRAPGPDAWEPRRGGLLEKTGEMRAIVEDEASWTLTMNDLTFHPPSEKAAWHQTGAQSRSRGGSLPARPIIELTEADIESFEQIFADWLDGLRSANRRRGIPDTSLRPGVFG